MTSRAVRALKKPHNTKEFLQLVMSNLIGPTSRKILPLVFFLRENKTVWRSTYPFFSGKVVNGSRHRVTSRKNGPSRRSGSFVN